jgi:hypothetical protein
MKPSFRRSLLALVALWASLLVAVSSAAEPRAADLETARRLFQEATALERDSAWHEASQKLDAALAIKETPGLHFHRAHCAEQLGELVLAARHYARSEEMIRAGAAAPDVEELLSAARARVLARVPRLTLAFPNEVSGASLEIDGVRVSDPPGTPVLLDPGRHRIIARAPGRRDFEMEITLVEGQTQTLEVSLAAPKPAPLPPTRAKGIGFSIARGSASDRIERAQSEVDASSTESTSRCQGEDPPPACAELGTALDDHDRATELATVGFVAAGIGAAATGPSRRSCSGRQAARSSRRPSNHARPAR